MQISDLVAGLLGKMFSFFNTTSKVSFRKIVEELSDLQIENLCELQRLRMKSDARNKGFLQSITVVGLLNKENDFFGMVYSERNKRRSK